MDNLPVPPEAENQRLDRWLSDAVPDLSRTRWQDLIKQGQVWVDGRIQKSRYILCGGEVITFHIPPPTDAALQPEKIDLQILYEDHDIIAIDKPAGMVVHPAPGHDTGTVVQALLYHCSDLQGVSGELRPGIVHRLDKDTSGVLVVAKNEQALLHLQRQFKSREVQKLYLALVWGHPEPKEGTVKATIGRSPHHRVRMMANPDRGREAVTHYEVSESFADVSLVRLKIETGRTHQIRVHMSSVHHPVLGDALYGGARMHEWVKAPRQMLHAHKLTLHHPSNDDCLTFTAPLPPDFRKLLDALRTSG